MKFDGPCDLKGQRTDMLALCGCTTCGVVAQSQWKWKAREPRESEVLGP